MGIVTKKEAGTVTSISKEPNSGKEFGMALQMEHPMEITNWKELWTEVVWEHPRVMVLWMESVMERLR